MAYTKSGKHHFIAHVKRTNAKGEVKYQKANFDFVSNNGIEFLERLRRAYAAHGFLFEYTDVIDLDDKKIIK